MVKYNKETFRIMHDSLCMSGEVILVEDSSAVVIEALKIAANVMDDAVLEQACWSREQHLKRVDWARKVLQNSIK